MHRRVHIVLFIAGAVVFGYLVAEFGIHSIAEHIGRAGWSLLYVFLIWFAIYVLNTFAWRLLLGEAGEIISSTRLFLFTVSGFALNYITPVVALGGEPYKMKAMSPFLGPARSVSAVVLYRMVHLLGHMVLLLTGIVVALATLPLSPVAMTSLLAAAAAITAVMALTLAGHRSGVFERIASLLGRFRSLERFVAGRIETAREMDELLVRTYRDHRGRFVAAVVLEFLSRVLMGIEVYVILLAVGLDVTLPAALFLYVVYSLVINLLFFVPMNLGAREGGLMLGLQGLAITPLLGVYLSVVMRIREFCWILFGLLFLLVPSGRRTHGSS